MKKPLTHQEVKQQILKAVEAAYEQSYKRDAIYQAKKPAILKRIDAKVSKLLMPFFTAILIGLVPTVAHAQLGAGWTEPMTPAADAVRHAVEQGLCDQAGVDMIRTLGQSVVVVNAGAPWPAERHVIMWYRKGPSCSGAFQYVPEAEGGGDRGPTGGYRNGWEVSWDPNSYVAGPGDATHPTGAHNDHPTTWRFQPGSGFDSTYATIGGTSPPPTLPPPVVTPPPAPVDLSGIYVRLDALARQLAQVEAHEDQARDAQTDTLKAAVDSPGWFKQFFGNKYVQMALAGVVTWLGTKAAQ